MNIYKHTEIKPKGAHHYIKGAWHKIGADDKVYIFVSTQWVLSTKNKEQYNREVLRSKKEDKFECLIY